MNRIVVALCCIFLTLNASAVSVGNTTLAAKGTSQAISISNDEIASTHITAERLTQLANTLSNYVTAADKDGTLATAQKAFLNYKFSSTDALSKVAFIGVSSYGFKGDEAQIEQYMSNITEDILHSFQKQVALVGLKSILLNTVTGLNNLAKEVANNPTATLHLANAHLVYASCRLEGEFLAIAAIGAVASLGGVNPLGDLLGAIGAVGAFVCYVS